MESSLTESEMEAVLQLIQLSGNSASDFQVFWVDFPAKIEEIGPAEQGEESVGETTSSSLNNPEKSEEEALPRRRKKFLRIDEIYRKTGPSITKRAQKRLRI